MTKPLFTAENYHGEAAPTLPDDWQSGKYYHGYFENKYGEQWLFLSETKPDRLVGVFCGDVGWNRKLKLVRISISTILKEGRLREKHNRQHKIKAHTGLVMQTVLAGACTVHQILRDDHNDIITLLLGEDNGLITCNLPEHVWLEACIEASGVELPVLTLAEWTAMQDKFYEELAKSEDTDEDEDTEE